MACHENGSVMTCYFGNIHKCSLPVSRPRAYALILGLQTYFSSSFYNYQVNMLKKSAVTIHRFFSKRLSKFNAKTEVV